MPSPSCVETIPFRGWEKTLRLSNGEAELIVTLEVGPRVLSYSAPGRTSPFKVYPDHAGGRGEKVWRNRGGHRLWLAPESLELTYFPDNAPVAWEQTGPLGVRLTPPVEATGFQKQIEITLDAAGTGVNVLHRITRTGAGTAQIAPWALTVMEAGGTAVVPQPPFGEHPRDLLPNRRVILWPYTDLGDPRLHFGRRFFTLRQQAGAAAIKIGLAHREKWVGYLREGAFFVKRFGLDAAGEYPDDGCNLELFTNATMLEVESLGPLVSLAKGAKVEHAERWELLQAPPGCDPAREVDLASLAAKVFPCAG